MLRSIIARQYAMNPRRDFPFLRELGEDLPGAVVLRASDDADDAPESSDAVIPAEQPLRFSLAGMQAKFSATVLDKRLHVAWRELHPTLDNPALGEALIRTFATVPLMRVSQRG